jgi:hypothetical protein
MLEAEQFVIEITHTHGVSDSAVGFMLSNWVLDSASRKEWLSADTLITLTHDYNLSIKTIEKMSGDVLDALEECGLYAQLMTDDRRLSSVSCRVKRDVALIDLEWT